MWRPGSKLVHPYNPELGIGIVRAVEGRYLRVEFPDTGQELTLAAEGAGLTRLVLSPGARARVIETGEEVEIAGSHGHRYLLVDGREVEDAALWPLIPPDTPVERLAGGRVDPLSSFCNRLAGLELMELREAGGLGSFLGGRIELFPHQLHAAERAVAADPVRWLLADEIGLGKTVEACLILSALVRRGRAQRALIVAPSTLVIQWLGELYRKFHQVFVLLDRQRIESVERDYGPGVNPFEVHPFAVISLELLGSDRRLLRQARAAQLEAIVLDEAHRLVVPDLTEKLAPLVREARHALLLTATPPQADRRGFYRLFALLHPEVFPRFEDFESALLRGEAVVPFTSAVRRDEVGGLPARIPRAIEVEGSAAEPDRDPRAQWLAAQVAGWIQQREKTLVFVQGVDRLEALARFLESRARTRVATFHQGHSAVRRDMEVASFRDSNLPLLLCSEAGGEGRNFQFCDRMLHFDLPLDPVELEQRIGRLDRIGRVQPVEILYFRERGATPDVAGLYERLDLFEKPGAGLDPSLALLRPALEEATRTASPLDGDRLIEQVQRARDEGRTEIAKVLYRDAYRAEQAESILARVPADLEEKTSAYCIAAAEDLGFEVIAKSEGALYYIEFGAEAVVDSLPGVPGGSRFLGTFDRAEALLLEEMDFFASGHPLVEGLLLELEDGNRGRAALLELPSGTLPSSGLLCVYKDGASWALVVVDTDGRPRPDWVEPLRKVLPQARPLRTDTFANLPDWSDGIRAMARSARGPGTLVAAAFFQA